MLNDLTTTQLGEMGFDSSLFNSIDSQLTPSEFKERLENLLQPILNREFSEIPQKTKIDHHHDRLNFACPYCRDSMKNNHAKRGNFILTGKHRNFFKCHNCGEFKRIDFFFKDFNTILKLDAINYLMNNIGDFHSLSNTKYDMSSFLDMSNLDKYAIDRNELKTTFGLIEVKDSPVWVYLKNRLQFDESKFLYNPQKKYLLILNLTKTGKILGAQKRMFSGNNRFETYKLSKLYEFLKKPLDVTSEQLDYLNTLSMIFNICLISYSKEITLFEGPMDAFLFKNSIANTGANKELPIDIPVRFFYDSDATGIKKSIEHIEKNEEVFLWNKFLLDIQAPPRKKWDLNDILIFIKQNNLSMPFFDKYFSNDSLDIIDL